MSHELPNKSLPDAFPLRGFDKTSEEIVHKPADFLDDPKDLPEDLVASLILPTGKWSELTPEKKLLVLKNHAQLLVEVGRNKKFSLDSKNSTTPD